MTTGGSGVLGRLWDGTLDQEPEHEDHLAEGRMPMSEAGRRLIPLSKSYNARTTKIKPGLTDELGGDAETKQQLVRGDVAGRRRCVTVGNQSAGDIEHGEESRYGHEDIQQACESGWVLGGSHAASVAGLSLRYGEERQEVTPCGYDRTAPVPFV